MEKNGDSSFLFEAEYDDDDDDDDDVFYAEIRRQILLLTSEENEDVETKRSNSYVGDNGRSKRVVPCFLLQSKAVSHFSYWENEKLTQVPTWIVNLWKTGKGTGVFIPQNVKCKTNHRRGCVNNNRRRTYKPMDSRYS